MLVKCKNDTFSHSWVKKYSDKAHIMFKFLIKVYKFQFINIIVLKEIMR